MKISSPHFGERDIQLSTYLSGQENIYVSVTGDSSKMTIFWI